MKGTGSSPSGRPRPRRGEETTGTPGRGEGQSLGNELVLEDRLEEEAGGGAFQAGGSWSGDERGAPGNGGKAGGTCRCGQAEM